MGISDYFFVISFIGILFLVAPFLGRYIGCIFDQKENGKIEAILYKMLGIETKPQDAKAYISSILAFSFVSLVIFFFIVMLFPSAKSPMTWDLALNTAISFMTNTNWQAYSGEVSLSPAMQMLACTVQNFVSAGTGIAVFIAFVRGLRNRGIREIGNFWQDITRSVIYLLLPLSFILSILLVSTGVVQTFTQEKVVATLEGGTQALQLGPVASQVAIKQLGTNGGGFFGVNSAHPFENPTPFSNFLQLLSILLIPCALVFTFGEMLGRKKHAQIVFLTMSFLWVMGLGVSLYSEHLKVTNLDSLSFMEGKEVRFSITEAVTWATATTAASNGSVNAMHSSLSPLSGLVALFNIMLGEIIFGGVGAGMYGMLIFIILTVFLSGLMVGRTPEYLQKKIDTLDMKLVIVALIAPSCTILLGSTLSVWSEFGLSSRTNLGPHGLSEILYAWSSAAGNNGSAFAGLNANTLFYNLGLGIAMLIGRFGVIVPALLIAGNFASKKIQAENVGKMSTDNWVFGVLLVSIIVIVGALTFFPALLLGPVVEHFLMTTTQSF
ncbi:MAG: potassium-transporting ATPase subunit KdpA [Bacteriovoracaceae bacterium]